MKIREAVYSDKKPILDFCKTTFSWGDYISDVWDYWNSEENLTILTMDENPVAMCHSTILDRDQTWIEGIRVKKNFRRKGFAKQLVKKTEIIAKKNNCKLCKMLIEATNINSLKLAKSLNYTKEEQWDFYNLIPLKTNHQKQIKFAIYNDKLTDYIKKYTSNYVRSWRWIPLSKSIILSLTEQKKILIEEQKGIINGLAILNESDHFEKTLLITLVYGTNESISKILFYIQNLSSQKNYKRIQILTKLPKLPSHDGLEKRFSFFLMKKILIS